MISITVAMPSAAELAQETSESAPLAALEAFPCATHHEACAVVDILRVVKERAVEIDARRTRITGPLLAAKKEVDDLFRATLEAFAEAEAILKRKLAAYESADITRRQIAIANGAPEAPAPALDGISYRADWTPVVVDINAVPRQWLDIDRGKLKHYTADYAKSETIPAIPGLRFERARSVIVRAK